VSKYNLNLPQPDNRKVNIPVCFSAYDLFMTAPLPRTKSSGILRANATSCPGHMDGKAMKLAKNLRHLLVSSSIPKKSKTTSNIMKIGPETGTRGSQITALT
jgi:hypothetical protein